MMKTKRKITVDDIQYGYTVKPVWGDGPGYVHIGIWLLEPRGGQKLNVRARFDDPWVNYGPMITWPDAQTFDEVFETEAIKPREVRAIILAALEEGWRPHAKGCEFNRVWDRKAHSLKPQAS